MQKLMTISVLATLVGLGGTVALQAAQPHNTANTISLETDHANSFRNFAPELPEMRARAAQINTDVACTSAKSNPASFL